MNASGASANLPSLNLRPGDRLLVLTGAGIKNEPPPLPAPTDLAGSDEAVIAAVRRAVERP